MTQVTEKKLNGLQTALSEARENNEISEMLYRRLESTWLTSRKMSGWDFIIGDEDAPTIEPEPEPEPCCGRAPRVVQESVILDTESTGAPEMTPEEKSSRDSEPAVEFEEQEIEVEASKAHAFTVCVRCPRVLLALLDSNALPSWLTDNWDWKHGIISVCCGRCRRPVPTPSFWGSARKKASKSTKSSVRNSSDIAEGMEAVNLDPEKLTGEVSQIARAIVGTEVSVITFPGGGAKYIDVVEFMENLTFDDTLFHVNIDKFRAGERRREELLEPFRGGYV